MPLQTFDWLALPVGPLRAGSVVILHISRGHRGRRVRLLWCLSEERVGVLESFGLLTIAESGKVSTKKHDISAKMPFIKRGLSFV